MSFVIRKSFHDISFGGNPKELVYWYYSGVGEDENEGLAMITQNIDHAVKFEEKSFAEKIVEIDFKDSTNEVEIIEI